MILIQTMSAIPTATVISDGDKGDKSIKVAAEAVKIAMLTILKGTVSVNIFVVLDTKDTDSVLENIKYIKEKVKYVI
jgi:hypothetical protein